MSVFLAFIVEETPEGVTACITPVLTGLIVFVFVVSAYAHLEPTMEKAAQVLKWVYIFGGIFSVIHTVLAYRYYRHNK